MSDQTHPSDQDLVRHLDGEPTPGVLDAHLSGCGPCRDRLRRLERRSETLHRLLRESREALPAPVYQDDFLAAVTGSGTTGGSPPRGAVSRTLSSPILRWAAVLALMLGGLVATPAGAWVVEHAAGLWSTLIGREATPPADGPALPGFVEVEAMIQGEELHLRLPEGGAVDSILFRRAEAGAASARLTGDADGEILVSADGFTIVDARPGSVLEVAVPPGIGTTVITVGERLARSDTIPATGRPWTVRLR